MTRIEQHIAELAAAPEFPVRPLDLTQCASGVVVRLPNWLGDAVMTLPALKQLRQLLETAQIPLYGICAPGVAGLCDALPKGFFTRLAVLSAPHRKWEPREIDYIRKWGCSTGILLTNSLRDTIALRRIGVKQLFGAKARCRGLLMKRTFSFPARVRHQLNAPHHALKYLSMVYALGAPRWDGSFPVLTPRIPLEQINPEFAAFREHPNVLLLAAGAAYGAGKRWPSESYHQIAAWQIARGGLVAVLGSQAEAAIGAEIIDGLPPAKASNLCGQTSFSELLHLFHGARGMVANDSGLMHLAAAAGLAGVAIFGPTDYVATGPVGDNWTILTNPAACSPCFYRECRSGQCCIARVTPEQVESELEKRNL